MGYTTDYDGRITATPAFPMPPELATDQVDVIVDLGENEVHIQAAQVEKGHNVERDVRAAVKALNEAAPREYRGFIHAEGEENDDIWRLYVDRWGNVQRADVIVMWPEDSPWG